MLYTDYGWYVHTYSHLSESRDLLAAVLRFSPYLIGYPKKSLSHNLLPLITLFCLSWSNILTPFKISFVHFSRPQRSERGSHYSAQHILYYTAFTWVCVCVQQHSRLLTLRVKNMIRVWYAAENEKAAGLLRTCNWCVGVCTLPPAYTAQPLARRKKQIKINEKQFRGG
jgi:hypothetical protein